MGQRAAAARGRIAWGGIFWLVVLGVGAYGVYRVLPIYLDVWRFEDHVGEMLLGVSGRHSEKPLREAILHAAQQYNIPIQPQDIVIVWFPNRVIVEIPVHREVDVLGFRWKIDRTIRKERPIF